MKSHISMTNEPENEDIKVAVAASADERSDAVRERINICMGLLRKLAAAYDKNIDNRGAISSLINRLFDNEYTTIMRILEPLEKNLKGVLADLTPVAPKKEERKTY